MLDAHRDRGVIKSLVSSESVTGSENCSKIKDGIQFAKNHKTEQESCIKLEARSIRYTVGLEK